MTHYVKISLSFMGISLVRLISWGCKSEGGCYLIIDHNVDDATHSVILKRAHIQGLIHNALPAEAAVTMQEDAQIARALVVIAIVLLCAHLPYQNRIHCLHTR